MKPADGVWHAKHSLREGKVHVPPVGSSFVFPSATAHELMYQVGNQEGQPGEKDKRCRREPPGKAGREERRGIAAGDDAKIRRCIDGLDETVPLDGQRGRQAMQGLPCGAPAGDRRHGANDAGTVRGERRGHRWLGRRTAGVPYPRHGDGPTRECLDA